MGLHGFCFAAIDSRSGAPQIPLGHNGMFLGPVLGTRVFMGSVLLPSIPAAHGGWKAIVSAPATLMCAFSSAQEIMALANVGAQLDDSGPSVGDTGLHGFCFAAMDSRPGTPNIPLGLNGMILGPVLAMWVFTGSVLLQSVPDLTLQTSRWDSTV